MTESAVGAADLDELDDAELIVRVRQREPEAFRVLYERHRDAVTRYARQSARNAAEAEDFVAETFVRVLQQLHDGRGPSTTFRAYAFTVVRNLAADRGRGSAREEVVADLPEGSEQRIEQDYIRRAFKNLPSRWQRVLWLSEVEGCKPAEMAPVLGVNASAASALAYRAREGLRQAYLLVHLGPDTPDDCRRTVDRLPAYVRSALSPESVERVDDHLEGCTSCRARHYEVAELDQNLRGLLLPLLLGGSAAGTAAGSSAAGSSGAALVSGQWRRLRELVGNPAVAVAVVVGLAVVGVGVLVSLPGLLSSDKPTVPPAAASPPAGGSSAPAVAPAPVRSSPRAVVGGGAGASPPVEGTRPVTESRRTSERPSRRPEASSRPPRTTPPPAAPSGKPTPTPTPPADDRCVELLVVKICGS